MTGRRKLTRLALLGAAFATLQCGEIGPEVPRTGAVAVVPVFDIEGASVVPVAQVRLTILRSDSSTVAIDTVVAIEADSVIELVVEVELDTDPEDFFVELTVIDPLGNTVFQGGPSRITVASTATDVMFEVPIVYTGPGFDAAGVQVEDDMFVVSPGDTVTLVATAVDSVGDPIAGVPILWQSLDPTLVTVPQLEIGTAVAGQTPGDARVVARLLTGQMDTVVIQIRPPVPEIALSSNTVQFNGTTGGNDPPSFDVTITNVGPPLSVLDDLSLGTITYQGPASDWLTTVDLSGATAPATVTLQPTVGVLSPGTYTATVPIISTSATNSPRDITVTLDVAGASTVTVLPATSTLAAGDTITLAAAALDAAGNPLIGLTFTWVSSDDAIATVNTSGLVTAVGTGTATITASSGAASGSATITVEQSIASVAVIPTTVSFGFINDTLTLTARALDANGVDVPGAVFSWVSSDPTMVSVDPATGLITALANTPPNTPVVITATTGSVSGNAFVTVTTSSADISVVPSSLQLVQGESAVLTATVLDDTGQPDPAAVVTWTATSTVVTVTSTSVQIASVVASATLTGAVEVIASSGALSDTVTITVLAAPTITVTVEPVGFDTLTSVGDSLNLNATALDSQGNPVTGLTFTWQSNLPAIATVTSTGPDQAVLIAGSNGAVTVTAQAPSGETGSKVVTIQQVAVSASVTPPSSTLASLGATVSLTGVATDARGNPVPGTWSSSDPSIATVNASGTVTAVANGTATIVYTAQSVSASASITVQQAPVAVQITPPSATTAAIGDTVALTARALDALGNAVTGLVATWLSADPASVSVVSTSETTATATALAVATVTVSATMGSATGVATIGVGQVPDAASSIATVPATAGAGQVSNIVVQSRDVSGTNLTAGGATVVVTVAGANPIGQLVVTDSANGRYGAQYTPTTLGADDIAITLNGTAIAGSPFTSAVNPGPVNAAASTASVPPGVAGAITTIDLQARDQFGHALTVGGAVVTATLTPSSINTGTAITVADNGDGTYSATYTPTNAGTDSVALAIGGAAVGGSPFPTLVSAGGVNPSTSTALVPSQATAGLATTVVVQGRDANGNPVTGGGATVVGTIVSGPNTTAQITVVDSAAVGGKPGIYTITYTPAVAGTDLINITLNGTPIAGTQPFAIQVIAGGVSGANSTASFTPDATGLPPSVQAGTPITLRVQAKDINGNDITTGGALVVIDFFTGPNAPQSPLPNPLGGIDNGDGTYDYFYTPSVATPLSGAVDSIAVTVNGVPIIGSPFGVHTIPSTMVPAQATVTINNDYTVSPIVAGTNVTFTVQGRDQFGNAVRIGGGTLASTLTGVNSQIDLNASIVDVGDGTYTASYDPTIAGSDAVDFTLDGVTVPGSPFNGTIIPSFGDFTTSTAMFTPGSPVVAGTPSSISVTALDAFGNITLDASVTVEVTGLNAFSPASATDNGDGTHIFNFPAQSGGPEIATVGVPDTILVVLDGGQGPGSVGLVGASTIPMEVSPGPLTVATSSVAIAPDYTVTPVEAGTSVDLTITTRDQFANQLQTGGAVIGVVVSGANAIDLSSSVVDNGDGTYVVSHIPTIAGNDNIAVTLNGSAASGSPFTGTVIPGPAASVTVTPNGAVMTVGSGTLSFAASALDLYENPVTAPVIWGSLNPAIIIMNPGGIAGSAGGTGQVIVTATVDGVVGYAVISVTDFSTVDPPLASWAPEATGTTESIRAIWGTSDTDITAVGHDGRILHWDGNNLTTERSGTGELLEGVWGTSPTDVFAVGQGMVLHYDGLGWTVQQAGAPNLFEVWGSAPDDVWAVGDDGTSANGILYHYDGISWTSQPSGTARLQGIWGSSATSIYAVGLGGTVLFYDGLSWSPLTSGTSNDLNNVWGTAPDNVYVAGTNSTVLRNQGGTWSQESIGAETDFYGIWGSSDENIFVSGLFGEIHRKDAQGWQFLSSGTSEDLNAIWGLAPDDVIIVGGAGTIIDGSFASTGTSGFSLSTSSLPANGTSTATITVFLGDANEGPLNIGGDDVVVNTTLGTISPVVDNDDGTYTATLTAPNTFGTASIDVVMNGQSLFGSATLVFTADPATSTITATPDTIIATGQVFSNIVVQLKDGAGNNAVTGGEAVTILTTLGNLTAVLDTGDGIYSASLNSNFAGVATITGTVGGLPIADNATVVIDNVPGAWTQTDAGLLAPRRDHVLVTLSDGRVLIVGGASAGAEIFDPTTYTFTPTTNSPAFRGPGTTATELQDGRVLIVGGNNALTTAELFDPVTDTFSPTGNTNAAHSYHTATLLDDGTVLVVAGQDLTVPETLTAAEIYDPVAGQFTSVGNLTDDRSLHAAALMPDGRVLISGGREIVDGSGFSLNTSEIYDPGTQSFTPTGNSTAFGYTHLLPLPNGLVLAVGALFSNAAELYDPGAGSFSPTGTMQTLHDFASVVLDDGGNVWVIGGSTAAGPVITNAVEVYNSAQGSFAPDAGLNIARMSHGGTLLLDGRILIVGGTVVGGGPTATAEIFQEIGIVPGPPRD